MASIWRILSLVTPNIVPTSSSVLHVPSIRPNLNFNTCSSLSVSVSNTSAISSFKTSLIAYSSGLKVFLSWTKSPKCESSSSPIGVSSESGSRDILIIF